MRNKKRREVLHQHMNPLQWLLQQNPDIQIQEHTGKVGLKNPMGNCNYPR